MIVLSGTFWASAALAYSSFTVDSIESPVWVERDGTRAPISVGDEIHVQDSVSTGDSGRIGLRLQSGIDLQLDVNSKIEILGPANSETVTDEPLSIVKFHGGRGCVQFMAQPGEGKTFNLLLGDALRIVIQELGHICMEYSSDLSRVVLAEGNVQITNLIEPGMVVLGQRGSEYRFDDTGYFELGRMETEITIEISDIVPVVQKTNVEIDPGDSRTKAADSMDTREGDEGNTDLLSPANTDTSSAYVFTVYVFSTRSQEVAREVNQNLRAAGHETGIVISSGGASVRYRVAVSGFSSRREAQDYATNIIGKHGISDTWIGRSKVDE